MRMVVCNICDKVFNRKDNLKRHIKSQHPGDDTMSNTDKNKETVSDYSSTDEEDDSDMETDAKDDEETLDPWLDMVEQCYKALQPDFDSAVSDRLTDSDISEKEARKRVFKELLPKYRKYLLDKYLLRVLWYESMRNDAVHKAIRREAKRLREEEDYDGEESWKYATKKRKYLFDKVFKQYEPPVFHGTQ